MNVYLGKPVSCMLCMIYKTCQLPYVCDTATKLTNIQTSYRKQYQSIGQGWLNAYNVTS